MLSAGSVLALVVFGAGLVVTGIWQISFGADPCPALLILAGLSAVAAGALTALRIFWCFESSWPLAALVGFVVIAMCVSEYLALEELDRAPACQALLERASTDAPCVSCALSAGELFVLSVVTGAFSLAAFALLLHHAARVA